VTLRRDPDGATVSPSRADGTYGDAEGFSAFTRRREKRRTWNEVTGFRPAVVVAPALHEGHDVLRVGADARQRVVDAPGTADEPAADPAILRRVAQEASDLVGRGPAASESGETGLTTATAETE
jgi:hypothetical protein